MDIYELIETDDNRDFRLLAVYENERGEQTEIWYDIFGEEFEGSDSNDDPCTWICNREEQK